MKILITGAAGFIGYHLTNNLLSAYKDVELVLVDNLQRGRMDNEMKELLDNKQVKFLQLDLTDLSSYIQLGSGYNHVYHLAAVNGTDLFYEIPHEVLRINTLSIIYMLEWFRKENKDGKFCFTSSNEAYAGGLIAYDKLPIPTPENVPLVIEDTYNPRWSYGGSKLIGELFVINYAQMYNLNAVIVRPHNFYGSRAGYSHVIPQFCTRIAEHVDPFPIYGSTDTRTFCYIEDAVRAMRLLMETDKTNSRPIETVHIGDYIEITMGDLLQKIFDVVGWKPKSVEVKEGKKGSVSRRLADVSKLQKITNWKPEVSLEEGLKKTYEWYKENPKK
ncbi:MAG: GDP-mannose 4,6-dehydratase [bacterium]|nr:GDP-mannose 4,6-dehydratase [bacterium]